MKILQNEQPATIYIEGIKYEFENAMTTKNMQRFLKNTIIL